jgi:Zn-dependent peptidase ImmA (M78 family)
LRATPPPLAVGARFRTALASAPDPRLAEAVSLLESLADDYLDLLARANTRPPGREPAQRSIEHLSVEQAAEDLAVEERNRLGLGDGPIQQLREILEIEVGLRVFIVPLPAQVAGLFVYVESVGGCVAANSNHPSERRRWTMAHEYAHFLSARSHAEVTPVHIGTRVSESERFADCFAANFLMPRNGLVRRFHELKRNNDGVMTPSMLVQLAHSYRVSVQALTLRLEDLNQLRSGMWDRLKDNNFQPRVAASRLGLDLDEVVPERLPLHYRMVAAQLFIDGDITETQFARFLHMDVVSARRAFERLTATRDVSDDGLEQIVDLMQSSE